MSPRRRFTHYLPISPIDFDPGQANRWTIDQGTAARMKIQLLVAAAAPLEAPSTISVTALDGTVIEVTEGKKPLLQAYAEASHVCIYKKKKHLSELC